MDAVWEHDQEIGAYALEAWPRSRAFACTVRRSRASRWRRSRWRACTRTTSPRSSGRVGVCVRAGHHCCQPLMRRLGVPASSRASFAIHSTREDVDRLVEGLARVREVFKL